MARLPAPDPHVSVLFLFLFLFYCCARRKLLGASHTCTCDYHAFLHVQPNRWPKRRTSTSPHHATPSPCYCHCTVPAASAECSSLATPACGETMHGSACTPPENGWRRQRQRRWRRRPGIDRRLIGARVKDKRGSWCLQTNQPIQKRSPQHDRQESWRQQMCSRRRQPWKRWKQQVLLLL